MSSSYRISLDKWLSELNVSADRVLDIGGSQLPVRSRVKSWDVKEYKIADLEEPHVDSPKPDIIMDLNKPFGNLQHYDLIFCLEVFDYIYDPMRAFITIATLLKPGGTAWASFPSVYPQHQPIEDDALRYFPGGVKKLAEAVGLSVEETIYRRPETNKWQEFFYAERMRAAKHVDHSFTGMIVRFSK